MERGERGRREGRGNRETAFTEIPRIVYAEKRLLQQTTLLISLPPTYYHGDISQPHWELSYMYMYMQT